MKEECFICNHNEVLVDFSAFWIHFPNIQSHFEAFLIGVGLLDTKNPFVDAGRDGPAAGAYTDLHARRELAEKSRAYQERSVGDFRLTWWYTADEALGQVELLSWKVKKPNHLFLTSAHPHLVVMDGLRSW